METTSDLQELLFTAVQSENISEINELIKRGADVNSDIKWQIENYDISYTNSFLQYAIEKIKLRRQTHTFYKKYSKPCSFDNLYGVIKCLVDNGANVNYIGAGFYASLDGSLETMMFNVYCQMSLDNAALCYDIFKLFLENGANPNLTSPKNLGLPINVFSNQLYFQRRLVKNYREDAVYIYALKLVQLFFLYGSDLPNNDEAKLLLTRLMLVYCLDKKNQTMFLFSC